MRFAPEYVEYVLNENFEDAKELLLSPLMAIHYAHLVMLAAQGIVSAEDAHVFRQALDGISPDEIRRVKYDGTYEDLFFYVERLVIQATGDEVAGRLLDPSHVPHRLILDSTSPSSVNCAIPPAGPAVRALSAGEAWRRSSAARWGSV